MKITSNFQPRDLVSYWDVPPAILADQFDYLEEGEGSFFQYKNHWYSLDNFLKVQDGLLSRHWDGYSSDSYFSGVLVKLTPDCESVIVGTYIS